MAFYLLFPDNVSHNFKVRGESELQLLQTTAEILELAFV